MYFPTVHVQTLLSVVLSKKKSIDKKIFKHGAYFKNRNIDTTSVIDRYNMPSQTSIGQELADQEDTSVFVNNILQTETKAFRHKV